MTDTNERIAGAVRAAINRRSISTADWFAAAEDTVRVSPERCLCEDIAARHGITTDEVVDIARQGIAPDDGGWVAEADGALAYTDGNGITRRIIPMLDGRRWDAEVVAADGRRRSAPRWYGDATTAKIAAGAMAERLTPRWART